MKQPALGITATLLVMAIFGETPILVGLILLFFAVVLCFSSILPLGIAYEEARSIPRFTVWLDRASAADREHTSLQRDLSGHPHRRAHGPAREQADQRGGHGDASRRAVLGHGPGGHVQVEPALVEGVGGQPELGRV